MNDPYKDFHPWVTDTMKDCPGTSVTEMSLTDLSLFVRDFRDSWALNWIKRPSPIERKSVVAGVKKPRTPKAKKESVPKLTKGMLALMDKLLAQGKG